MIFYKKLFVTFVLVLMSCGFAFSYSLADAQKAYVQKDWKLALAAFQEVCPNLSNKAEQISCAYWHTLALSQTGRAEDFKKAGKKLDSLIAVSSSGDALYAELIMTRAQFEMYLKKYARARVSLRQATECASPDSKPLLTQVCAALEKVDSSQETKTLCEEIRTVLFTETNPEALVSDSTSQTDSILQPQSVVQNTDSNSHIQSDSHDSVSTNAQNSVPLAEPTASAVSSSSKTSQTAPQNLSTQTTPTPETYTIQVGAFGKKENAQAMLVALKSRSIEAHLVERISSTLILYLVQTGTFSTRQDAVEYAQKTFTPLNMEFSVVKNP